MAEANKIDGATPPVAAVPDGVVEISEQELEQRKAFLELREEDVAISPASMSRRGAMPTR